MTTFNRSYSPAELAKLAAEHANSYMLLSELLMLLDTGKLTVTDGIQTIEYDAYDFEVSSKYIQATKAGWTCFIHEFDMEAVVKAVETNTPLQVLELFRSISRKKRAA